MDIRKVGDFNGNKETELSLRSLSNVGHRDMNRCFPTDPGQGSTPQETNSGPSLESSGATTFPLLRLPPELRQFIYEPLIVIGDLSVMRINKLVHNEAVNVLSKSAVLRLAFRYSGRKALPCFPVRGIFHLTSFLELRATSAYKGLNSTSLQLDSSPPTDGSNQQIYKNYQMHWWKNCHASTVHHISRPRWMSDLRH